MSHTETALKALVGVALAVEAWALTTGDTTITVLLRRSTASWPGRAAALWLVWHILAEEQIRNRVRGNI